MNVLGPYAIEQDYSQYLSRVSGIIFCAVGTATKGEVGTPILCTSTADFVRKFGSASKDHLGTYAAQYYLTQGNRLYYLRISDSTEVKGTTTIPGKKNDTDVPSAIVLTAKTPGTYYNTLKVVVQATTIEKRYRIVISESDRTIENIIYTIGEEFKSSNFEATTVAEELTKLTPGTYTVTGGTDGTTNITDAMYVEALKKLTVESVDMNLFAIPGVSSTPVIQKAIEVAETRGDCLFLVDPPKGYSLDDVIAWHNGSKLGSDGHTGSVLLNSSFAALYYSWQNVYDSATNTYFDVPPSVVVASVMAKSARDSELWFPPAGVVRGIVQGVKTPVDSPDSGARTAAYMDPNAVNCIIEDPTYGLVVYGQKTLSRANTALNRVNVRMLLNYLKRVIVAAAKYLTFEPNDDITWNSFEDLVEPTLRNIGQRRGLYDYKIVKGEAIVTDEDIDNYRMPCKILIKPTKSVEEIPIYFTITSTGADFNEILESESVFEE